MKQWGTHHGISSVANARSNGRAEVAVKSMKRLLMDDTGVNGHLNTDNFLVAILQYRNTPDIDGISPAMYTFHRPIRDFLPDINISRKSNWEELNIQHQATREKHITKYQPRLHEHTKKLPQLSVGTKGNSPTKWDLTGEIAEVRQFDQYVIKLDHSGRNTLRNRKYLKVWNRPENTCHEIQPPIAIDVSDTKQPTSVITPTATGIQPKEGTAISDIVATTPAAPQQVESEGTSNQEVQLYRPQRARKPPDRLSYKILGNPS